MGATGIEWTKGPNGEPGFTFNPWIGCTKILGSDPLKSACLNCYAEGAAKKLETQWGPHATRRGVSEATWRAPLAWDRRARREGRRFRVFVASMADVLDNHRSIQDEWREQLYSLIALTPNLDWLMLTKRPENARRFLPSGYFAGLWPHNLWFGVTAETQDRFNHRTEYLRQIPAPVRFVSVEPMLGPIILPIGAAYYIDWIICGGESGRLDQIRDTEQVWMESLCRQSRRQSIAYFQKQLAQLSARKAYKDFANFPETIRVREHPKLRLAA